MSKITTHTTEFERPDLLKAALDLMGAHYQEQAPIPGAYSYQEVDFAIDGTSFGYFRGIGYAFNPKSSRLERKMDDMDLVWSPSLKQDVPCPEVADFETRLHNHYNLALLTEQLAQGQVDYQHTVLEDGSIIVEVTDYAFGA